MTALHSLYLGLELRSPIVASAGPATGDLELAVRLEEAGAGALVLPSLFEEEILQEEAELNRALDVGVGQFPEASGYFPAIEALETTADRYLATIRAAKKHVSIPVIASLNGATPGGWARYARVLEDAGADALELNLYRVAADAHRSAAQIEHDDLSIVAEVRRAIGIPLAVKLSPYYSALANFAGHLADAGADGLVLFNRFYQPDLDLDSLEVVPRVELSSPAELRLPLRWLAILQPRLARRVSLAASTGVHSGADVAKALLVGADVAMMTSAVLRHGPEHIVAVEGELRAWMTEHGYESVRELRGSVSHAATPDPAAFERAHYRRTLHSWAGRS
ncbi:MAG TPA: dihydroorotate dehydrogenase-like protein [Acidimicrobiia bacterium]|nr:dihydroorotate dehydrogenase-like protein [Acidimicrobiia bacterium]